MRTRNFRNEVMVVYRKEERDYFKWVFGLIVFMLGMMLTVAEVGGQTLPG